MTPSWVLLDNDVGLCFKEEDGEAAAVAAEKNKGVVAAAPPFELWNSTMEFLGSMTPEAILQQPPKISTIRLRCSKAHRDAAGVALGAVVACADKSLLVLYGGNYTGPGSSRRGCYLIYDAAVSVTGGALTLTSTVPPLPLSPCLTCIGAGAVALRSHPPSSSYLLAELATSPEGQFPDAELYLWRSDLPAPQWEKKAVRLPEEVRWAPDKYNFCVDIAFSFDTSLCWIDLLQGLVVCHNPLGQQDPQFRFIKLPDGCPPVSISNYPYRPRIQEFRTAAWVAGAIKLVALEGYLEDWDSHQYRLVTWTLTPDLSEWKKCAVFNLTDIWASERYLALKIEQHTPVCPVLSPLDDGVVYVVVNDVEVHNIVQGFEVLETKVDVKGQYVLGLDMPHNKVISIDGGRPAADTVQLTPTLIPTVFCSWLQSPKDRQREAKASEVGESGKKLKVV
ncbi:hypothetical protein EJB05_24651 [Eragrostis curvula]|uniref:DUF1618 domain-containing protein n=1 Tax=Eragrostis curvula TaxID=38414 RepID=A0A5J9VB76_9POAL|nr:hypothetical protein EJB05_24651 [Eragrostis curvula]